jgi:ankyrin repeat protein
VNRKSKNGYLEIVETLIDAGANTELKNEDGDTPLMLAVRSEHSAVVDAMCKRGCDLHTPGFDNLEPIDYAKTKKNLYLSDMLSKHEARILKNNSITEHEEEIYDAPPIVATPSVIH